MEIKPEELNNPMVMLPLFQDLIEFMEMLKNPTEATLDFPSIGANSTADLTITVEKANINDGVILGPPDTLPSSVSVTGFISATNQVTVRAHNSSGGSVDPPSATYKVWVINDRQ